MRQEGVVVAPLDTVVASVCGRSNGGAHPLVPRVLGVDVGVERIYSAGACAVNRQGLDALAVNRAFNAASAHGTFALVAIAKTGLGVVFGVVGVGRRRWLVVVHPLVCVV